MQEQSVTVDSSRLYEQLASEVKAAAQKGQSLPVVAATLGINVELARNALRFAVSGTRPKVRVQRNGAAARSARHAIFQRISKDVVRHRDAEQMTFVAIAKFLGVSQPTVQRAYDYGRPEFVQLAASKGTRLRRGRHSNLKPSNYDKIREMLRRGDKANAIAKAAPSIGLSAAD